MSNFPILDLVVGIIFIYFLLGIITNAVIEIILTIFNARADILRQWLVKTFAKEITSVDANGTQITIILGNALMDHFAIAGLTDTKKSPSYIDPKSFTVALIDKLAYDPQNAVGVVQNLKQVIYFLSVTKALHPELQRTFLAYAYEAQSTYEQLTLKGQSEMEIFQQKLENWFNASTSRLSGNLKRRYTMWLSAVIGAILVITLDADSIRLAQYLYANPQTTALLAQQASQIPADSGYQNIVNHIRNDTTFKRQSAATTAQMDTIIAAQVNQIKTVQVEFKSLRLPLGDLGDDYAKYVQDNQNATGWIAGQFIVSHIAGWLLTIFAISLGAPFWFDLLGQLANIRGTGTKPLNQLPGSSGN